MSVYTRHEWHKGRLFPHGFSGCGFEFCASGCGEEWSAQADADPSSARWSTGAHFGIAGQRCFISSTNHSRLERSVESEWTDRELYMAGWNNIRIH